MNTRLITNMKNKKKKKGFTLIELIIVIAILAILAALALPKFGAVKETANKSADLATAKNIQTAVSKAIAEDKIDLPAVSTTEVVTTASTIGATIDGSLTPKLKANSGSSFTYSLDHEGTITVYITATPADILFPRGAGHYAS